MQKEYVEERGGCLYVAGSRVSLDSIIHCFLEGMSAETIWSEFETLTLAQVYGAIAHYLGNQQAMDAYRVRQAERSQALRSSADTLSSGLRERLDSAKRQLYVAPIERT